MFFHVEFFDGTAGEVRGGPWIDGRPECFSDLFRLKIQVCQAKELVDWVYLRWKYGIKEDEMLRIGWVDNSSKTVANTHNIVK